MPKLTNRAAFAGPIAVTQPVEVIQDTHDDLNANANIQVADTDVGNANPVPLARAHATATATILNGAALSDEFDMRLYVSGDVYVPAAWTAADIGFYAAPTTGGTFMPLYDDNGNITQITAGAVTSQAFSFPPEVFACRFIKFWSQNAGVDANQGAQRLLVYELKS